MQRVVIARAAVLGLLFSVAIPGYAQHEGEGHKQDGQRQEGQRQEGQRQEGRRQEGQRQDHAQRQQGGHDQQRSPNRQDQRSRLRADRTQERHDRAQQQRPTDRPTEQSQEVGHRRQNRQPAQERRQSDRNRQPSQHPSQQGRDEHGQRAQMERSGWDQHRAHSWESEHRTWEQRGGYRGYRIPDDRFRGYFGPEHGFRVRGLPFLVVGGYPRFQYSGYWVSALDPWPEYWGDDWYDNDEVYVAYVDHGYYLFNRRYPRSGIAISISL